VSPTKNGPRPRRAQPTREAFFVRVVGPNDEVTFVNATDHVGKPLPFRKPKATLAMAVSEKAVCFSLLHISAKAAPRLAERPILIPRGSFARAERKLATLEGLTEGVCLVEHDGAVHRFDLSIDESGLSRLTWGDLESDEPVLEQGGRATQLHLYLWSNAARRPLAVSFIGHISKPGTAETLLRAASMALYSMSALNEFRILSGIEVVDVPPPANRYAATVASRRGSGRAMYEMPVWLFTEASLPEPVAHGGVAVEIDMENSNPATGRLLVKLTPSADVAATFDQYRATMDGAIHELLRTKLGDEDIANITYDIVLGSVTEETVSRLVEALQSIGGMDLTETRARPHPVGD
jgi:hypothetical protein